MSHPETHINEIKFGGPITCRTCGVTYKPGVGHVCTGLSTKPPKQVGGTHYETTIQPIEYIEANCLGFHEANVVKYITRYKDKNGLEDLKKAKWYIDRLIELEESNGS